MFIHNNTADAALTAALTTADATAEVWRADSGAWLVGETPDTDDWTLVGTAREVLTVRTGDAAAAAAAAHANAIAAYTAAGDAAAAYAADYYDAAYAAHAAAAAYIARQQRREHPAGKFDNAGRWQPSAAERCDCCDRVRTPSRAYKYSLMVHCRTMAHIANLYGVSVQDVRKAVRLAKR